jgi:hypothetical protein
VAPMRRQRFLRASAAMVAAHREVRAMEPGGLFGSADRAPIVGADTLRSASFAACLATEVAYESQKADGTVTGDFTAAAVPILRAAGPTLTRAGFIRRVHAALGDDRMQTPYLDAKPGIERRAMWSYTT